MQIPGLSAQAVAMFRRLLAADGAADYPAAADYFADLGHEAFEARLRAGPWLTVDEVVRAAAWLVEREPPDPVLAARTAAAAGRVRRAAESLDGMAAGPGRLLLGPAPQGDVRHLYVEHVCDTTTRDESEREAARRPVRLTVWRYAERVAGAVLSGEARAESLAGKCDRCGLVLRCEPAVTTRYRWSVFSEWVFRDAVTRVTASPW